MNLGANPEQNRIRLLITAGPTHEPIDAVRYIGNRSSGRVGAAVAQAAATCKWDVRLLMGPAPTVPPANGIEIIRFRSTADLERLLAEHLPWCDLLIMAAAVSDYTPRVEADATGKWKRGDGPISLELVPTPDLLAGCAARRRPDQVLVGFALEPRNRLTASARAKLERKDIDFIVANPLETMDSDAIAATLFRRGGEAVSSTDGPITKPEFARWLLDLLAPAVADSARSHADRTAT
ncbi:MAG: hypothetical protein H6810_09570 [Phycisphaeraceae bacterium]|nr:MAG: hypothetical protein H6810_09570 [Phycisphaeraceae bacterium]